MTQPTITDLLAGLIDLAPSTPPHRPGSCSALCVPACDGGTAPREVRHHIAEDQRSDPA
ncbi:MAG: hypothetical protein ACJ74K_03680 [Actinomycetes bacterium]|jgi:hypothetical protein